MSSLEQIIDEIEADEDANDMHFSLYSIPYYYNPPEEDYINGNTSY